MHLLRVPTLLAFIGLLCAAGCHGTDPPAEPSGTPAPESLRLVAQGTNTELQFKADHAGSITVSDFTSGEILYQGTLKAGDVFILPPNSNRAKVNKGFVYLTHDTNIHDEYRLHFLNQ
jgi:hypothetical protein